jgi:WS/DGAT/MGAT family acyltransferase
MEHHALPAADAAWLHMDRPTNPMVVNSLVLLGEPLDVERAKEVFGSRVVGRFPRFRQRVVEAPGRRPAFEDDPHFAIDNHLHRIAVPPPGDEAALRELVDDLITATLDRDRPLWHAYLIEGYGDGGAVLVRTHHCIADGIALARLMLSITDQAEAPVEAEPSHHHGPGGLLDAPYAAARAARVAGGAAVHEGMETLAHPRHVAELARTALRDSATVAKLLGSPPDGRTVFKEPLAGRRRVAWSRPFPLDAVKAAGRHHEATINDVLVAALTGALRDHLSAHGPLPDEIRAMVPFNLRPLDAPIPEHLGNDFALILLSLPVGVEGRRDRLDAVRERMDAIKDSHEAPISYGILSGIGLTPPQVEDRLIGFFTEKASMVVTNVPGPRERVSLAGSSVEGVFVWAPCSGSIGTTVSILSYAGDVTVGFMTDVALVPDPRPLADAFAHELTLLCRGAVQPAARPQS